MTEIDKLAEIVGGKAEIARLCGVSRSIITRYSNKDGRLPVRFRKPILDGLRDTVSKRYRADEVDDMMTQAMECLPSAVCPCCGQSTEGMVV